MDITKHYHYKKDTIGYHYEMAKAVFGKESKAVKWLEYKAAQSTHGMDEDVIIPEDQVLQILGKLHLAGKEEKSK